MILHNAAITGSLTVNGTDVSSITGSSTYSASFAAQIASINTATSSLNSYTSSNNTTISALNAQTASLLAYTSSNDVKVAGLNTFSSSILSYTASNDANVTSLFANVTSLSAGSASSAFNINALSNFSASMLAYTSSANTKFAGLDAASGSAITRLSSLENRTGSYATTGSNTFVNSQYISALNDATGFTTTASLYTDGGFRVTKDAYLSSSLYIKGNLTVYGTQSVSYITSSQLNISTNLITVNTDTPAVRFGGLSVYDSGSTGLTGSMLWDSQNNHWVYSNPSGSSYSGGMFISGPRTATLGSEQGTSACMLLAGQGGDHLTSSMIYHSSTVTCIPNTLAGGVGCFSGAVCSNGNVLIGGSGTCNYLPKFTGTSTVGNSIVQDNSTGIIINGTDNYTAQNGGWFFNGAGSYTNGIFASSSSNNLTLRAPQVMSFESGGALRMTLDASGNLGLGVTPSSWTTSSSARALQLNAGSLFSFLTSQLHLEQNSYFNSGFFYVNNGLASAYRQVDGVHLWLNAPSGTAGNAISFTQAMTLNACGRLILGNTTDNTYSRLQVAGGAWIGQNAGRGLYFADGASYTSVVGLNQAVNTYNAVELRASGVDGQLFLATSGNVGVGTINPSDKLTVTDASTYTFNIGAASGGAGAVLYTLGSAALTFATCGSSNERMRITSTGNVGIGTTSPQAKLDISSGLRTGTTSGLFIGADVDVSAGTRTNDTRKLGLIASPHYSNATRPVFGIAMDNQVSNNFIYIGGAYSGYNAATTIAFSTGATTTTETGTERMRITSNGRVGMGTTAPCARIETSGGGYILRGGWGLFCTAYTDDGLFSGCAQPNLLSTNAYGGANTKFGSDSGLILGYQDNGAGLYSPAYGFEVRSTDGRPVTGNVVKAIVMRDTDTGAYPFWINNNGSAYFANCVGIGTSSPSDKLQVLGSIRWGGSSVNVVSSNDASGVYLELNGTSTATRRLRLQGINDAGNKYTQFFINAGAGEFCFVTEDTQRLLIGNTGIATFACQVCTPQVIQSQPQGKTLTLIRCVDVNPSTTGYMSIDVDPYVAGTYRLLLDISAAAYGNSTDGPGVFKLSFGGYYSTAGNGLAGIYVNCMTNGSWGWNRSGNVYCIAVTNTGSQAKFVVGRFDLTWT